MTNPEHLAETDAAELKEIRTACPELDAAARHVRDFATMMRDHRSDLLPAWLDRILADDLPTLNSLVNGLRRDIDAVTAAFSTSWSSGQVEGHVTRVIKLLKRKGLAGPTSFSSADAYFTARDLSDVTRSSTEPNFVIAHNVRIPRMNALMELGIDLPARVTGPHPDLETAPSAPRPVRVRAALQLPPAPPAHRRRPTAARLAPTDHRLGAAHCPDPPRDAGGEIGPRTQSRDLGECRVYGWFTGLPHTLSQDSIHGDGPVCVTTKRPGSALAGAGRTRRRM